VRFKVMRRFANRQRVGKWQRRHSASGCYWQFLRRPLKFACRFASTDITVASSEGNLKEAAVIETSRIAKVRSVSASLWIAPERMSGAALAKVDLNRQVPPNIFLLHRDEIDAEAAENPLVGQYPCRLHAAGLDVQAIFLIGGEAAAEKDLAAPSAQHLIVGGNGIEPPGRIDPDLDRRRLLEVSGDELQHDALRAAAEGSPGTASDATFTLATPLGARALAMRGVLPTRLSAVVEAATMDVLCAAPPLADGASAASWRNHLATHGLTLKLGSDTCQSMPLNQKLHSFGHPQAVREGVDVKLLPHPSTTLREDLRAQDQELYVLAQSHARIDKERHSGNRAPPVPAIRIPPHLRRRSDDGTARPGRGESVDLAMAERWFVTFFNQPGFDVVDWRTNALCGDGCMMERISSEAGSLAGHLAVSRRAKLTPVLPHLRMLPRWRHWR
jgi:hypothetical protein